MAPMADLFAVISQASYELLGFRDARSGTAVAGARRYDASEREGPTSAR